MFWAHIPLFDKYLIKKNYSQYASNTHANSAKIKQNPC